MLTRDDIKPLRDAILVRLAGLPVQGVDVGGLRESGKVSGTNQVLVGYVGIVQSELLCQYPAIYRVVRQFLVLLKCEDLLDDLTIYPILSTMRDLLSGFRPDASYSAPLVLVAERPVQNQEDRRIGFSQIYNVEGEYYPVGASAVPITGGQLLTEDGNLFLLEDATGGISL